MLQLQNCSSCTLSPDAVYNQNLYMSPFEFSSDSSKRQENYASTGSFSSVTNAKISGLVRTCCQRSMVPVLRARRRLPRPSSTTPTGVEPRLLRSRYKFRCYAPPSCKCPSSAKPGPPIGGSGAEQTAKTKMVPGWPDKNEGSGQEK